MKGLLVAAPLLLALFGGGVHAAPAALPPASQMCAFEPSGTVYIEIGAVQVFSMSEACGDYSVSLSPADGTAGFSSGTGCSLTEVHRSLPVFKVRGCEAGTVTATVSSGVNVPQMITITVVPAS